MKQVHLKIRGRVQGVFFRLEAKKEAERLGISGWIKNNSDGTVETEACGNERAVDDFIAWCRQGSSSADVAAVEDLPTSDACPESSFQILY